MSLTNRSVLLSICIATMNRPALLDETLASLQADLDLRTELVIVDGSVDQKSAEVVKKWQPILPAITYYSAPPQGVDQDYSLSVQLARGKYCWLMTDDDLLVEGAVKTILDVISHDYPLIIINASVFNVDFSECIQTTLLEIKNNQEYQPSEFEAFFEDTAAYLSFIGGVIIRRDIWNSRLAAPYFGTEFVHVGIIFQQAFSEPIFVIARPLIKIRYGNALWSHRAFRIWMFNWPNLIWSFPDFSESSKSKVCDPFPYRRLNELIKNRAKGCYSLREYKEWLAPRLTNPLERLIAYTVARLPGGLVNKACIAYLKAQYPDARALLIDLQQSPYFKP